MHRTRRSVKTSIHSTHHHPHTSLSAQWFLKAADRGNVRAQHRVGLAYETGRGVGKDITQALQWYHKAADNDSGESWNRIGRIYDYGTARRLWDA